ncbi:MAG: nickel-dependent hydrogenase large subunit, partial [Candidatus Omnitrophica bacterium]|nr:nickel-dependent hydrogenase large subunit [Candidatus Omnitrophota bacterium]
MAHKVVIPIGPYHPLQEEPEFFRLYVEGEKVVDIDIVIGYMHRGIEELSEHKHFDQVAYLVERICGICSTSHPFAYVNAMEDLAKIKVPERALYIRTIVGEMERLHSHLLWLGLAGHFIGYNTVWMWAWKYREPILDCFEMITGNRNHYAMFKIGGVRRDILDEHIPELKKMLDELSHAADMFRGAVTDDPVIKARLKGIGVLTEEQAKDFCVVGPTARASGIDIDVRRDDPYGAYGRVEWKVIVEKEGDIYAKTMVRIRELYESIKIIRQCLDKMPNG